MECPYCGKADNEVIDSRLSKDGIAIRRRRQCLICSSRFTTYESTEEQILPVLVGQNTGRGTAIPHAKRMLSIMSRTLTVLSDETEKLIGKVDKLEKTQVAKGSERKAASEKKAPEKKEAKSLTSSDQVVNIIKGQIQPAEEDILKEGLTLDKAVKDYEKSLILEALEKSNWVKAKAARLLNINRTTLVEKIKKRKLTETPSV